MFHPRYGSAAEPDAQAVFLLRMPPGLNSQAAEYGLMDQG